jgi:methylase of polypeptide subunit release factors
MNSPFLSEVNAGDRPRRLKPLVFCCSAARLKPRPDTNLLADLIQIQLQS